MPIECPIKFPRLTTDQMREFDYRVMEQAFQTQRDIGCLCDEVIYECRLKSLLMEAGFQVDTQVPVSLSFRSFVKPLFLDLVLNRAVIYELKTVAALTPSHFVQLLIYLLLTNAARGKLINFRPAKLETRFVNSTMDDKDRRRFKVDVADWHGPADFRTTIEELVSDWGTGLEHSLYLQAIIHCLGGDDAVTRQIPMAFKGVALGNQRFHLMDDRTAFRLTTFQDDFVDERRNQLYRLIVPSPLKSLHWINIARYKVRLVTINK